MAWPNTLTLSKNCMVFGHPGELAKVEGFRYLKYKVHDFMSPQKAGKQRYSTA